MLSHHTDVRDGVDTMAVDCINLTMLMCMHNILVSCHMELCECCSPSAQRHTKIVQACCHGSIGV